MGKTPSFLGGTLWASSLAHRVSRGEMVPRKTSHRVRGATNVKLPEKSGQHLIASFFREWAAS